MPQIDYDWNTDPTPILSAMESVREIDIVGKRWEMEVSMDGLTVFIKSFYIEEIKKAMYYYHSCSMKKYNVRSLQNAVDKIRAITESVKEVESHI